MKVRFGLVGCGGIGNTHADALASIEEAELTAVCDVDLERARAIATKYAVKQVFVNAEEMLKSVELDAVAIASDHRPMAVRSREQG